MKILMAAVAFVFMATAADARHTAPDNNLFSFTTENIDNGSGNTTVAPAGEAGKISKVSVASGIRKNLLNALKGKREKSNVLSDEVNNVLQDQNPQQGPAKQIDQPTPAQNPQEVKSIPKARRVERPAKVESNAKRSTAGSAKRGNMSSAKPNAATAKPNRGGNPNQQVGNPARANRPTGAGRPNNAGKPNRGKGKN